MTYRDAPDDPARDKREAAKERLIALAEADNPARKLAAKTQQRAQKERAAFARTAQKEADMRVRDSIAGSVTTQRLYFLVAAPMLLAPGYVLASIIPVVGVPLLLGYVSGMLWSVVGPTLLMKRERRWLQSLPFGVSGYFEALRFYEEGHGRGRDISLRLCLKDSTLPALELLQKLFGRLSSQVKIEEGEVVITRQGLQYKMVWTEMSGPTYYSNQETRSYLRALFKNVLLPLHEAYPIKELSILSAATTRAGLLPS